MVSPCHHSAYLYYSYYHVIIVIIVVFVKEREMLFSTILQPMYKLEEKGSSFIRSELRKAECKWKACKLQMFYEIMKDLMRTYLLRLKMQDANYFSTLISQNVCLRQFIYLTRQIS